ncbi:MAG: nicotinate-nucleotide adenylyltransferase [Thermoleophilia bacterium]
MDPLVRLQERRGQRLGIMGGTFDPIHIGHLVTAEEARRQFSLDEIVFMPTGEPPHKAGQIASPENRFLMAMLATTSHPHFWVSRLEIDAAGTDYTADTLAALRARFPEDTSFFFITGADAVLDILTWKEPERVLELCQVIAATRPGYDLGRLDGVLEGLARRDHVHVMEIPALAVSSSMIRERLRTGKGARYLVPDGVATFLDKACLYGPGADGKTVRSRLEAPGDDG